MKRRGFFKTLAVLAFVCASPLTIPLESSFALQPVRPQILRGRLRIFGTNERGDIVEEIVNVYDGGTSMRRFKNITMIGIDR